MPPRQTDSSQVTNAQSLWRVYPLDPRIKSTPDNHFVIGRLKSYHWSGSNAMSMKCVLAGEALFEAGGSKHKLEANSYLLLNSGSHYTVSIESERPVEAVSVFYAQKFIDEVHRDLRRSAEENLSDPFKAPSHTVEFFERVYPADVSLEHVRSVRRFFNQYQNDHLWIQEQAHTLMQHLIRGYYNAFDEIDSLSASRAVTREELYRRLYKAKDFADATLDEPVTLDQLAYVACLSTNYFLRTFKDLFKLTPHQYIIQKRLERSKQLLRNTNMSVSEICLNVGFQSLGSFSWLFKRRIGVSPEAFRLQASILP